jgi:hypothetical protein
VATTGGYVFCSERVGRWQSATAMTKKANKVPFDSKLFLATVNGGRSISKYRTNQKVFAQGSSADAVFYIQNGGDTRDSLGSHIAASITEQHGNDLFH